MRGDVKVSINILPFGHMKLRFSLYGEKSKKKEIPIYTVPRITSIERVEILYKDQKGYKVPETTDGR